MNDNNIHESSEMIQQALQGDIRCQMLLGYNYLCPQDDVKPNYEEAIKYFKMAAEMGVAEAEYQIAECLCLQEIKPSNISEIFDWYLKAANHGFERAYYDVALSYANGHGTKQNFSKAFFWAQKGYECKDARSTELMGEFYECGVGIGKDCSKAFVSDPDNSPTFIILTYIKGKISE